MDIVKERSRARRARGPEQRRRRSLRLRGYDYTQPGAYFVTICTHERAPLFGQVVEGEMHLNACGKIVREEWLRSPAIRQESNCSKMNSSSCPTTFTASSGSWTL